MNLSILVPLPVVNTVNTHPSILRFCPHAAQEAQRTPGTQDQRQPSPSVATYEQRRRRAGRSCEQWSEEAGAKSRVRGHRAMVEPRLDVFRPGTLVLMDCLCGVEAHPAQGCAGKTQEALDGQGPGHFRFSGTQGFWHLTGSRAQPRPPVLAKWAPYAWSYAGRHAHACPMSVNHPESRTQNPQGGQRKPEGVSWERSAGSR